MNCRFFSPLFVPRTPKIIFTANNRTKLAVEVRGREPEPDNVRYQSTVYKAVTGNRTF